MKTSYIIDLKIKGNKDIGYLVPLEQDFNISFEVKRIFYTYNVPFESNRGSHAYCNTKQILICVSGSLKIRCFDGVDDIVYKLDTHNKALYIEPMVWRTTFDHSSDAVLLVLSSLEFDEEDYIRDYNKFLEEAKCI